jgi:sugar O-acyltransferase (sialic acid O-acetyltransferase NeuD family)
LTVPPRLLLVGAGGLGRETAEAVRALNASRPSFELLGFLDDDPALEGTEIDNLPVVGRVDDVSRFPDAFVVLTTAGTHDPATRWRIAHRLDLPASRYATIVHPHAILPTRSETGSGSVVLAAVVASTSVRLGHHVVVMPTVVFTHDNVIEDYATFGAGVRLGGRVRVGQGAYVGAGALVREDTTIGPWSIVGMGAVVIRDVAEGERYAGVPGRHLGQVNLPWDSDVSSHG